MNPITRQRLKTLETEHRGDTGNKVLRVYYGWARLNKVQKKEALTVAFENEPGAGQEPSRASKSLRKVMDIVCERMQTPGEASDAAASNRCFTCYDIFLNDRTIKGSLARALRENRLADEKNVPPEVLDEIETRLRERFLETHPGYAEPLLQGELF
jgi:hypothetical protein